MKVVFKICRAYGRHTVLAVAALFVVAGGVSADLTKQKPPLEFTPEQRNIADQIISVFENNTKEIQYSYCENLGDGRGYTAGRSGFTSATGDMLEVIEQYTAEKPDNEFVPYLPTLRQRSEQYSASVKGLAGLCDVWKNAGRDSRFRQVQDAVLDRHYYSAAVNQTLKIGATMPLTLLALYDAAVQHGDGEDADGLAAMVRAATESMGGTPLQSSASGAVAVDEKQWLREFLLCRKKVLRNPSNKATRAVWSASAPRVDTLLRLLKRANYALDTPLKINPWGTKFTITPMWE